MPQARSGVSRAVGSFRRDITRDAHALCPLSPLLAPRSSPQRRGPQRVRQVPNARLLDGIAPYRAGPQDDNVPIVLARSEI